MYYIDEEIQMRRLDLGDADILYRHREDMSTWKTLGNSWPSSYTEHVDWLQKQATSKTSLYMMASFDIQSIKESIGIIRVTDIDYINSSAVVGCDVFKDHRGQGYASRIMTGICRYMFKEMNMYRLELLVMKGNLPAIKTYEKVGFKHEGVKREAIYRGGQYHDYLLMGMLRDEFKD